MPNFHFHGTRHDLLVLLDLVFLETDCIAYEATSRENQRLVRFRSAEAIDRAYPGAPVANAGRRSIDLRLWFPVMGRVPAIERVVPGRARERLMREGTDEQRAVFAQLSGALRTIEREAGMVASRAPAAWREHCEGWGLLVLQQACLSWNSEARARRWCREAGWNWHGVESAAAQVRQLIRGLSVMRAQSRPVLADAAARPGMRVL